MRVFDGLLRVAGGVFAVAMGAGLALLQAVSTPGFWPMPVAAAAIGNAFLVWFVRSTVEWHWAWLLPALPWTAVMVTSMGTTREGDQLANSWTGLATFAAGAFVFFLAAIRRPPPAHPTPAGPTTTHPSPADPPPAKSAATAAPPAPAATDPSPADLTDPAEPAATDALPAESAPADPSQAGGR